MSKRYGDGDTLVDFRTLSEAAEHSFELRPDRAAREALANALGIEALSKLRFTGSLQAAGPDGWQLRADLGATVVQACIVSLAPVTTRIDERVSRTFVADLPEPEAGSETESPDDETIEALPQTLDLTEIMAEALSLALPTYPRAEGAELSESRFAAPGVAPLEDADLKPFAQLKALRDQLSEKDDG